MGNLMSCVLICGAMEVVQVVNTNGRVEKLIRPIRAAELIWAHERYKAALANPSSSPPPPPPSSNPPPRSFSTARRDDERKGPSDDPNAKFVLLPLDPSIPTKSSASSELGCRAYKFQCLSQENVSIAHPAPPTSAPPPPKSWRRSSKHESSAAAPPSKPDQSHRSTHAPFRVKKEGGVTTLVVSKRYLEQLLADKEMRAADAVAASDILRDHNYLVRGGGGGGASSSSRGSRRSGRAANPAANTGAVPAAAAAAAARAGVWRPALESISESYNVGDSSQQFYQRRS